jgi:hypothetical protein
MKTTDELAPTAVEADGLSCIGGRALSKYVYAHLAAVLAVALFSHLERSHRLPPERSVAGLALGAAMGASLVALFVCPTVVVYRTKAGIGATQQSEWFALVAEVVLTFGHLFAFWPLVS